jgi:hypothetical protein
LAGRFRVKPTVRPSLSLDNAKGEFDYVVEVRKHIQLMR